MIIIGIVLVILVFVPSLWVRWVMNAYSKDLEGMPGTGGELADHLIKRFGGIICDIFTPYCIFYLGGGRRREAS